jgi:hypothetical protein
MSVEIPCTKGYTAVVDDEDYELVSRYSWYADEKGRMVYASTTVRFGPRAENKKQHIKMHRLIAGVLHDPSILVDHWNRDSLDNRRSNIRIATPTQNSANMSVRHDNTVGYKGVRVTISGMYQARIKIAGRETNLGSFSTPEEAAMAYNEAAASLHGEFAGLNVVGDTT